MDIVNRHSFWLNGPGDHSVFVPDEMQYPYVVQVWTEAGHLIHAEIDQSPGRVDVQITPGAFHNGGRKKAMLVVLG